MSEVARKSVHGHDWRRKVEPVIQKQEVVKDLLA